MVPLTKSQKPTLRERALKTNENNPSQLGDPISLKAETSETSPTSEDRGAVASSQRSLVARKNLKDTAPAPTEEDADGDAHGKNGHPTLRQKAMQKLEENPSQLGDPVSLKAEKADSEPTDQDRGAAAKGERSKL
jgi:hypothetical protein